MPSSFNDRTTAVHSKTVRGPSANLLQRRGRREDDHSFHLNVRENYKIWGKRAAETYTTLEYEYSTYIRPCAGRGKPLEENATSGLERTPRWRFIKYETHRRRSTLFNPSSATQPPLQKNERAIRKTVGSLTCAISPPLIFGSSSNNINMTDHQCALVPRKKETRGHVERSRPTRIPPYSGLHSCVRVPMCPCELPAHKGNRCRVKKGE